MIQNKSKNILIVCISILLIVCSLIGVVLAATSISNNPGSLLLLVCAIVLCSLIVIIGVAIIAIVLAKKY